MKIGAFGSAKAYAAVKTCFPAQWWSIIGREDAPNLTRLAMHIYVKKFPLQTARETGLNFQ